jgi:hypothetical protein
VKENFVIYDTICEKIMKIDEALRFVGVYTHKGEMACSRMRENTTSMLTPEQIQMSMYYAKLRHETREHLSHNIGKEEFSMTKYEKVIRFTIPFEKDLLLISADTDANYAKIVDEILKVIEETKKLE